MNKNKYFRRNTTQSVTTIYNQMNKIHSIIRGLLDMKLDSSNDDFEKIKRLLSHFDLWFCLYLISKEDKDAESFEGT